MYKELRERVFEANIALVKKSLIIQTFGNVSEIDRINNVVAIKPSGVSYSVMRPDDIVILDIFGKQIYGSYKPSSDTPTHLVLYRAFDEISGIVHTHSTHATIFAQAKKPCLCFGTTHADTFYGQIPVTEPMNNEEIKENYEANTGEVIVRKFLSDKISPEQVPGVLVSSHGPFAWGKNAMAAVDHAEILEEVCKMALFSQLLTPGLSSIDQSLLDKHYLRKHGSGAYYGQG